MKLIVIYNPKSGTKNNSVEEFKRTVSEKLTEFQGQVVDIIFKDVTKNNLSTEYFINKGKPIKAIIIAGGDGTISSNIQYAVENKIPLGIIPSGTFNNFASDNNIPDDLMGALNIIKNFNVSSIDIGKVGKKYFINNSSIGLYAKSVMIREKTQKKEQLIAEKEQKIANQRRTIIWVFITVSGISEIESIPSSTRKVANSG